MIDDRLASWSCCLLFLIRIDTVILITLAVTQLAILIHSRTLPCGYAAILLPSLNQLHLTLTRLSHRLQFRTLNVRLQILLTSKVAAVLGLGRVLAFLRWTFLQFFCIDINCLSIFIAIVSSRHLV